MNDIVAANALFNEIRHIDEKEQEYWFARELQGPLNYMLWQNFHKLIKKAKLACENSGFAVFDHFIGVNNMIEAGKGAQREVQDYRLSRYACYLVAMNGDPRKQEVAAAQTYFAAKTREAELQVIEAQIEHPDISKILQIAEGYERFNGAAYAQSYYQQQIAKHYPPLAGEPLPAQERASLKSAEALLTPTEIGKELGIVYSTGRGHAVKVNQLLRDLGYQEKIGEKGPWSATEKGKPFSERKPISTNSKSDKDQLFWYASILDELRNNSTETAA